VNISRARRLRALRHLPIGRVPHDQADWTLARILHELPELASEPFTRRMIDHLAEGNTRAQVEEILGDTRPHLDRGLPIIGGGLLLLFTVVALVTVVVLVIAGAFATAGVVLAGWVGSGAVLTLALFRPSMRGWGCLPRRHAALVEGLVADRAPHAAWAHYRAVRGIALDDESTLIWWFEALREAANLKDPEQRRALLHDCRLLSSLGHRGIGHSAMTIGRRLMRAGL